MRESAAPSLPPETATFHKKILKKHILQVCVCVCNCALSVCSHVPHVLLACLRRLTVLLTLQTTAATSGRTHLRKQRMPDHRRVCLGCTLPTVTCLLSALSTFLVPWHATV